MRRAALALVTVGLLLGACSGSSDDDTGATFSTQTEPPPSTPSTPDGATTSPTTGRASPGEVVLTPVADVDAPIAMAVDPSTGEAYIAERAGRVVPFDDGEVGDAVVDITADVSTDGFEQGLLGLAFDPTGEHLYLSYSDLQGDTQVDELAWVDGAADPDSRRSVFSIEQPFANHNGGNIAFGPDGYLYLGLGDGGSAGDPLQSAQDPSNLLGKILRIDPSAGDPYAVPDDNPFTDASAAPEIWLYGVRNPWRFSFDPATGDLWVGDVGQDQFEEIDWLAATDGRDAGRGANLGWSEMEATHPYDDGSEPANHTPPVFEYDNDGPHCSVTGGVVYRGSAVPGLEGAYVYGDYCFGEIRYLRVADDGSVLEEDSLGVSVDSQSLASFGVDADGEIYILSMSENRVYRLDPA